MSATNKLSDRIANSVRNLLEYHQNNSYFGKILLTGDDPNAEQVIKLMWKNLCNLREWWFALLDSALQKSDSEDDRSLIETIISETHVYNQRRENRIRAAFGPTSECLLSNLMPQSFWLCSQYLAKEALFGSLNDLLTVSFAINLLRAQNHNLKLHPQFKPNPYFDVWCGEDLEFMLNAHKLLLDSKESVVSAKEEKHLIKVVKKTIAIRHLCCMKSSAKNNKLLNSA